ncbi:hypothetical protein BD626DRAFT_576039 [Schizophyllum amplum]|uniref:Uncharacterized protein n=1 Tax=Schizophyllum amplum TaxID=97359 RepID=A0A550BUK1_9AGAR|nr:hypothetical protein BD626DRAFT_576039 [Auriculariopsis ampla]
MYEISAESIGVLAAFHLYLKILASTATSAEDKHAISLQIHHLLDTSSPVALLEQDPPEPSPTVAVTPLFQHLVDTLEALCAVHTAAVINQSCDFIWDKLACTVQQIVRWIDFAHQTYSITPSLALTCPELVPVLTRLVYFIVVRLKPQLVPIVRQNPRLWTLAFELWLHYPAAYDPRASQRLTVLGGTAGCEIVDHMTTHVQNEPDIVDMLRTEFRRYVGGHHFQRRLLKLLALRFDPVDETVARHSWMYHHLRASMAVLLAVGGECAPISRRFFRAVIAVANETAQDVACGTRHGDLQFAETYLKLVIVSLCETICGVIDDSRSPRTIINAIQAGLVCFLMEHAPVFERFEEVFHADIAQIEDALAAQCCLPPALKVLHHHHADLLEDNTRSAEARRRFPRLMYAFKRHWAEYARFRTERLWAQSITCCNRSTDTICMRDAKEDADGSALGRLDAKEQDDEQADDEQADEARWSLVGAGSSKHALPLRVVRVTGGRTVRVV